MLGIDTRAARITWSVAATLGLMALAWEARQALLLFVAAVFFAYLLSPVVSLVDRFASGRMSRSVSLALVYVVLIGTLVLIGGAISARASQEAVNLVSRMPDLAQTAGQWSSMPLPSWLEPLRGQLFELIEERWQGGVEQALPLLKGTVAQVVAALGNVGFALLVPVLSFFFLKEAAALRTMLIGVFGGGGRKAFMEGLLDDMHRMLGSYIRALFLLSVTAFVAYELFFQAAGVPYAALLATIGGILEFIPIIGPLATAVLACVVAGISGYPHIGWMIGFFMAFRVFQDYVMQPLLLGGGLELHPLLILFGALAGEQIGGITGMVLSVPVMATLRLIWVRSQRQMQEPQ
jgi:predicted PurR-regulated permease PerM